MAKGSRPCGALLLAIRRRSSADVTIPAGVTGLRYFIHKGLIIIVFHHA